MIEIRRSEGTDNSIKPRKQIVGGQCPCDYMVVDRRFIALFGIITGSLTAYYLCARYSTARYNVTMLHTRKLCLYLHNIATPQDTFTGPRYNESTG